MSQSHSGVPWWYVRQRWLRRLLGAVFGREPLLAQCVQWHIEASEELLRAQERIAFLQKQIIIEQKAHHEESAKCAILEANYEQVQARWHKLMERKDLQVNNRVHQ